MGCSYKVLWIVFLSWTMVFLMFAVALFIAGAIVYQNGRYAMDIHEHNTCEGEVIASSYFESICRTGGRYGRNAVCYVPVWLVTYSIVEETPINATIQNSGLWTTEAAQNRLDQRQIGMSYSCWCNVIEPSTATWDEPSTFDGMMVLIGGGIAAALGFVGIFLSHNARVNSKQEVIDTPRPREVAW